MVNRRVQYMVYSCTNMMIIPSVGDDGRKKDSTDSTRCKTNRTFHYVIVLR